MPPFLTVCESFQGLPKGAVQNAMERDGLDPSIMDLDPEKSVASQIQEKGEDDDEEEEVDKGPPLKEDPTYMYVSFFACGQLKLLQCSDTSCFIYLYSKYFKMLKMVSKPEPILLISLRTALIFLVFYN